MRRNVCNFVERLVDEGIFIILHRKLLEPGTVIFHQLKRRLFVVEI
jgi:hypothetical protein